MKRTMLFTALAAGLTLRAGAETTPAQAAPAADATVPAVAAPAVPAVPAISESQAIEAFGWYMVKRNGIADQLTALEFSKEETDAFVAGVRKALDGKDLSADFEKAMPVLEKALMPRQEKFAAKQKAKLEELAAAGAKQVEADKAKPGAVTTPSGLVYQIVAEGTGESPKATDIVTVHYTGTLADGTKFDSSYDHADHQPATFPLDGVIPGWTEGIQKAKRGGKIHLSIPANLAYGARGQQGIPPNSALFFDVELIDFKSPEPAPAAPTAPAVAAPAAPAPAAAEPAKTN